jgi:hypothetical protein
VVCGRHFNLKCQTLERMMTNFFGLEVTGEIGAMAAGAAAIVGGFIGLKQFLKAERWRRAEFAITQVERLSKDDALAFCCYAIDWGVGPLIIPEKYRALFAAGTITVDHDWKLMAKALRPQLHSDWENKTTRAQFLLYRRAFDEFFSYLDALAMYRALGVVTERELSPLTDYLSQLARPRYWEDQWNADTGAVCDGVFGDFIKQFYGDRVWPWILEHVTPTSGRAQVDRPQSLPASDMVRQNGHRTGRPSERKPVAHNTSPK